MSGHAVSLDASLTATGLGLIVVCSIPALKSSVNRCCGKRARYLEARKDLYEDEDGSADVNSQKAHSDLVQRVVLVLTSALGVIATVWSLTWVILDRKLRCSTSRVECNLSDDYILLEQWLALPKWILIFLQTLILYNARSTLEAFRLGVFICVSAIVSIMVALAQGLCWYFRIHSPPVTNFNFLLLLTEVLLGIATALAATLIPRRPDVFRDGKVVDRQHTVSLLSRALFSWATPTLHLAARQLDLEIPDLPLVSHDMRANTLRERFEDVFKGDNIWTALIWPNKNALILQWTAQFFQAVANSLPQVVLYFTLQLLEQRDAGKQVNVELWLLVLAFGASDWILAWLDEAFWFVCENQLVITVYEQLSVVVFAKALRKKDIKGVSSKADIGDVTERDGSGHRDRAHHEDGGEGADGGDEVSTTKQSTINLIGVDGDRIAQFVAYNALIFGALIKVALSLFVLVKLMGWAPPLAGFGAFFTVLPVNAYLSAKYTNSQDALMKTRDSKMSVITEALQGIRQIKFSALENEWFDRIGKMRKTELTTQWRVFMYDASLTAMWLIGPICLSMTSLTVYALIHKELTASIAFTAISIFESLELTLVVTPDICKKGFDALVSARRIQEYLSSTDREHKIVADDGVVFRDATITWPSDASKVLADLPRDTFKLQNLNLVFPVGELSLIAGKTGSGKSLLIAAITGEADILDGRVFVPQPSRFDACLDHMANKGNWLVGDAIAYVSQIPWVENATIKDNILFGLPLDRERYNDVLTASALVQDLDVLQDGDLTDIGPNGINLSGGQKWRVSFARALYSRAGILIMDDIFSAVDAHVGKHLFEKALNGSIGKNRTRILVTHHVALCLPKTSYFVLLDNGTAKHAGPTEILRRQGLLTDVLVQVIEEQSKDEDEKILDGASALQKTFTNQSARSLHRSTLDPDSVELTARDPLEPEERPVNSLMKFVEAESRETGAVKLDVYKTWFLSGAGVVFWICATSVYAAWVASFIGRSYWISIWTRAYSTESVLSASLFQQASSVMHTTRREFQAVKVEPSLYFYLGVYVAISFASWLIATARYLFICVAAITASKTLFERLSNTILRAPLRFLDITPIGRILNRFTADFNYVDSRLAIEIGFVLHMVFAVLAIVIAGAFVSPLILVAVLGLMTLSSWYANQYLAGAREIKRLESNAKSPVFEQFGSVLTGLGTIRAFGKTDVYLQRMQSKIDMHCQALFQLRLSNRWMSLRVAMVGSSFILVMGVLVVSIPGVDASLAGFALSFSLALSQIVIWFLQRYSGIELGMNAMERIIEYSNVPIEDQGGQDVPAAWPTKGEIEVRDLVVAYAANLTPVLRGLSFSVKKNERVGVVGRTGAGKSSLTLALFRFIETRAGSIHIDGIDVFKIKLHDLRSRLAIIPQDPMLFSGTIRSNLDAFNQYEDSELRDALSRVHLVESPSTVAGDMTTPSFGGQDTPRGNINMFHSLSSAVVEGGHNLSQGQRQLLCLARAIIARPKIMILDEATSSVDMETDALIQRSIREEFNDSTLLVIAHRLSTVADFDRILVLGEGQVLEFDTPKNLMARPGGAFRAMVEDSGERLELEKIISGTA